jgi:hypothetical protein
MMKSFHDKVIIVAFLVACAGGGAEASAPAPGPQHVSPHLAGAGGVPQFPVEAAPPQQRADAAQATQSKDRQVAIVVSASVPAFLQTAFIEVTSPFTATTYDFVQQQAAGRMTMEIRTWQRIGTLGWQSFQQFTADYQANDQQVSFTSPTGFTDTWTYYAVGPMGMDVIDSMGRLRSLFNCSAPGWPLLIALSTRSCSGF